MDKNTLAGMVLLGILFVLFNVINQPSAEKQEELRKKAEQEQVDAAQSGGQINETTAVQAPANNTGASQLGLNTGGEASFEELSNDQIKLTFSSKGGRIFKAELDNFKKAIKTNEAQDITPENVILLDGDNNRFSYDLNIDGTAVSTGDLDFQLASKTANSLTYRMQVDGDSYIDQIYTLKDGDNMLGYDLHLVGMDQHLRANSNIALDWKVDLIQQESDIANERYRTSIYYRYLNDDVTYLSETSDDEEDLEYKDLHWVGMKQQFFNQTLISEKGIKGVNVKTETPKDEKDPTLKTATAALTLGFDGSADARYPMKWYIGENKYDKLKSKEIGLENMVYLGWTLFRWVNLGVIIPLFGFLGKFIGNYGVIILVLTLLIKLVLFPLTFKQFKSMAAMKVIQPEIAAIKEKYPDDAQKVQQETMKLYSSAGVNPLGGCLPMLLQFPILLAMYSFFPSALELRQEQFLWATDLSTYDSIAKLPFGLNIPYYGSHISLFTLLTAGASMFYSRMNSGMQAQDNPQMKIMMYVMPFFLIFIFNSFSAALTFYYFLYNIFSMAQHWIIKAFFINDEQIRAQISENKKKPKKQSKFQKRLEEMMKQQQSKMEQQQKGRSGKK